jgi:hypothetical protein
MDFTWSNCSQTISPDDTYTAKAWLKYSVYDKNLKFVNYVEIASTQTIQVPIPGL